MSPQFYPRQSLVNQDALQEIFYFKSAKLTQCWFNFAVSWRCLRAAAMGFLHIFSSPRCRDRREDEEVYLPGIKLSIGLL